MHILPVQLGAYTRNSYFCLLLYFWSTVLWKFLTTFQPPKPYPCEINMQGETQIATILFLFFLSSLGFSWVEITKCKAEQCFSVHTQCMQFHIKSYCAIALTYLFLQIILFLCFSSQKSWPKICLASKANTETWSMRVFQFYNHYML